MDKKNMIVAYGFMTGQMIRHSGQIDQKSVHEARPPEETREFRT